jgi:putative ABC transport system permease protein
LTGEPPGIAEWIVRTAAAESAFGSSLVGDLCEGYERRGRQSRAGAEWWYWRQAISIGFHFGLSRIARPGIVRDTAYAARRLIEAPLFTGVVVITLALGIGANTAILQLIDNFYLRKLPVPSPDRIVGIYSIDARLRSENPLGGGEFSSADVFRRLQRANLRGLTSLASYSMEHVQGSGDLGGDPLWSAVISGAYFETLGITAQRGRLIRGDEADSPGDSPVVVISDRLWREKFGADEGVVGRAVGIGRGTFTIIGVAPSNFTGLHPEGRTDIWIPGGMVAVATNAAATAKHANPVVIFGRLAKAAPTASVQADCDNFVRDLAESDVRAFQHFGLLVHVRDRLTSYEASPTGVHLFVVLWIMVALLHLAACTNVASLMLARASARRREIGIRLCLGASRGDILRLSLLEAALLALVGAMGGVLVARWLATLIGQMQFLSASIWTFDARMSALVAIVTALTIFQFGLLPALESARNEPLTIARGVPAAARRIRDRSEMVVVVQVAISVALLANAAAFVGLYRRQSTSDPGYDVSHTAVVRFSESGAVASHTDRDARHDSLVRQALRIPGVRLVSAAVGAPLFDTRWQGEVNVSGSQLAESPHETALQAIGPGYFATIGARIAGCSMVTRSVSEYSSAAVNRPQLWELCATCAM